MSDLRQMDSGATRSKDADAYRYDLITPHGMKRLAKRYADGAVTHGDRNWEKGIPASVNLNHLEGHLQQWKAGDTSEDHLAAIAWGVFALMHFEATMPAMNDIPARQPEAQDAK